LNQGIENKSNKSLLVSEIFGWNSSLVD
jgi:hypothetical protein